jgi:hypothetical protein
MCNFLFIAKLRMYAPVLLAGQIFMPTDLAASAEATSTVGALYLWVAWCVSCIQRPLW